MYCVEVLCVVSVRLASNLFCVVSVQVRKKLFNFTNCYIHHKVSQLKSDHASWVTVTWDQLIVLKTAEVVHDLFLS